MNTKNYANRRQWLQIGLGTVLSGMSLKLLAKKSPQNVCIATHDESMGPFHPNKDQRDKDFDLTRLSGSHKSAQGKVIYVRGKVIDENCALLKGALVMIWQANAYGKYNHEYDTQKGKDDPNFQGFGQVLTNDKGEYGFKTIKPAAYPVNEEDNLWRTPHIHFKVSKRGYHELTTQMYFADEVLNEQDLFASVLSDMEKSQVIRKLLQGTADTEDDPSFVQFDLIVKPVRKQDNKSCDISQFVGNYLVNVKVPELQQQLVKIYGGKRDKLILTITKENAVLFAEMPIQPKSEIFSKSRDRYSYKAFDCDIEFQRNSKNVITGLMLHRHYDFPPIFAEKLDVK